MLCWRIRTVDLPGRAGVPYEQCLCLSNGASWRTRTVDFYIANVALYQLSYTPGCVAETSRGPG